VQKGVEFDLELVDIWGWLVEVLEEEVQRRRAITQTQFLHHFWLEFSALAGRVSLA